MLAMIDVGDYASPAAVTPDLVQFALHDVAYDYVVPIERRHLSARLEVELDEGVEYASDELSEAWILNEP